MARPQAADHSEKREVILRAAARLFADEGYGRASMAQVAAASGISKAAIYHYWPGKDALLFDILDTHLSALRDRICGLDLAALPPAAQLRAIVAELLMAYAGADAEHGVQLNAIRALPEDQQEILRGYQRELVRAMQAPLVALAPDLLQDRGRLRAMTMSVFAMVNWHYQWDGAADTARRLNYADLVTDLMIGGLKQRA